MKKNLYKRHYFSNLNVVVPVKCICMYLSSISFGKLLRKCIYRFQFRLGILLSCISDNIHNIMISNVLSSDMWVLWHSIVTAYCTYIIFFLSYCFTWDNYTKLNNMSCAHLHILDIFISYFTKLSYFYMDHEF